MDQSGLATMEGGMRTLFILLAVIFVVGGVTFFYPDVMDRTIQEGVCPMVSLPICEERQEQANVQDDQNVPPWERDGHEPVTPASSPPRTEPTSPQVTPVTEQPELVPVNAPVSEGGVDPWGVPYDELSSVPAEGPRTTCAFVHLVRGVRRDTPIEVRDAFVARVLTRICTPPPTERSFPEGVVCEPSLQRQDGTLHGSDFCYTARRWRS